MSGHKRFSAFERLLVIVIVASVSALAGGIARHLSDRESQPVPEPLTVAEPEDALTGTRPPPNLVGPDADVVAIFMTFCGECRASVEGWNELRDRGVAIVGVTGTMQLDAEFFIEETGIRFPVKVLEGSDSLAMFGLDTWTLVLDEAGTIAQAYRGAFVDDALVSRIADEYGDGER